MQEYGRVFARVYDRYWTRFAKQIAPDVLRFLQEHPVEGTDFDVLDVCCGTGQLASILLENGYTVVGIDKSEPMLELSHRNNACSVEEDKARFIPADVCGLDLDLQFALAISTFDSMNHLNDKKELLSCLRSVYALVAEGGHFIFDLNTRSGLLQWNRITVEDFGDAFVVTRGIFSPEMSRAYTKITGFCQNVSGAYDKFDETFYNFVYAIDDIRQMLADVGWTDVRVTAGRSLYDSAADPEAAARVFFRARR